MRPLEDDQDLAEWTCIYIKYLQIYRKLEAAYDQMLHPQKRRDMRSALTACMGRMLEVRHDLVCICLCKSGLLSAGEIQ